MEKITIKEILLDAANLIEIKGWSQKALARDINGNIVSINSPKAETFCAIGAMNRALKKYPRSEQLAFDTLSVVENYIDNIITNWNDSPLRTKEEVIKTMRDCAATL